MQQRQGQVQVCFINLNIAMEYTGEGFLFGFVAARHRSSARFEIKLSIYAHAHEVMPFMWEVVDTIDFVCIAVTH